MINLTDKHGLLKQFKDAQLNKSLTMFEWTNLPETLPAVELEKMLQINGYAVIAEYQGEVYAFQGGFSGQDAYNRPTKVIVNNPALQNNSTYTINEDCVVIMNDDMKQGLIKIYEYFGQRLIENQITMLMTDYNLRMPFTISSSDDATTQSAKEYLNKIIDGSLGVIGEQKLFKALNVTPTNNKTTASFADLYGYQQFILAQLNNTIGLATNNNMKRERLTTNEIEINKNASYPLVDNMLKNRQQSVEKINSMFGLDITVGYSSIWGSDNSNSKVIEDDKNAAIDASPVDDSYDYPAETKTSIAENSDEPSPATETNEVDEPSPATETKTSTEENSDEPSPATETKTSTEENSDEPSPATENKTRDDDNEEPSNNNDKQDNVDNPDRDGANTHRTTSGDDDQPNNDEAKKGSDKK